MKRSPWQMPEQGLPATLLQKFWDKVDMATEQGHWLWTGIMIGGPSFDMGGGAYVSAARIAWALKHKDEFIPNKLIRSCKHERCINPSCREGPNPKAAKPAEEINRVAVGSDLRTVEALGAIQFGLPIRPRTLQSLKHRKDELNGTRAEIVQGPDEEVIVEKPAGTVAFVPNDAELAAAPKLAAEKVLELLRQPDTVLMTFKTGHVWLITPRARIDADSIEEAVLGQLVLSGQHRVVG